MLLPGFVDLQVNGHLGVDFSDPDLDERHLTDACRALLDEGTIAFLPTLITAPEEVYRRNLPMLARLCARLPGRALGIHLEGPFLSPAPGAAGAHDPRWMLPPEEARLSRLVSLAGGRIRLLTLAAELPGAARVARRARRLGIAVSLGHQLASAEDLARLARAGARALTHLGNGVPSTIDRHRNPIWAGLAEDALTAMLITDGHHLPPELVKVIVRVKGAARVIVTSDASPVTGLTPGRYRALGGEVELTPAREVVSVTRGCLAGSAATLLQCMNVLASLALLEPAALIRVGLTNPLRLIGAPAAPLSRLREVRFDPRRRRFSPARRRAG